MLNFSTGEHVVLKSQDQRRFTHRPKVHMVMLDGYHTVCGQELDDYNAVFFDRTDKPINCKRCLNNRKGY